MKNLLPPLVHLSAASLLALQLGACSSTGQTPEELDAATPQPSAAGSERTGVVMPGEYAAISLWPEAYSGEWLVLELRPAGTPVVEGDLLARLDTTKIDEQIADAQLEFDSARVAHENLLETHRIAQEAAQAALQRARAGLARSRRGLEGFENQELAMRARADELAVQREGYRVDDQRDELAQLEAMYQADELTDATEEIVLKRSVRNLQLTIDSNALNDDQRSYRKEFDQAAETERRREAVEAESLAVEHLVRKQAVEQAARQDAEQRSAASGAKKEARLQKLKRDRELFTVLAPRAGVLLHGDLDHYRPGKAPASLSRGSKLTPRSDVLMVAEPTKLAVAVDVPESQLGTLGDGAQVRVRPKRGSDRAWTGRLTLPMCPTSRSGDEGLYAGNVEIDSATSGWTVGTQVRVEAATE